MSDVIEVRIPPERHLVILGQLGNIQVKINQLEQMFKEGEGEKFQPHLNELQVEVDYLIKYYPGIAGGGLEEVVSLKGSPGIDMAAEGKRRQTRKQLTNTWRDIRLLVDMAHLNYTHEGHIDCHLKIMLDEALDKQQDLLNIDGLDDIPF